MRKQIRNFYPRSPCGERPVTRVASTPTTVISIHALLAESDRQVKQTYRAEISISIHALLAESDHWYHISKNAAIGFLSTLSLRRATHSGHSEPGGNLDFYPRSPCGERPYVFAAGNKAGAISIHALLAESDGGGLLSCFVKIIFLSTLSLRRATSTSERLFMPSHYFYPRSPCGERRSHSLLV